MIKSLADAKRSPFNYGIDRIFLSRPLFFVAVSKGIQNVEYESLMSFLLKLRILYYIKQRTKVMGL